MHNTVWPTAIDGYLRPYAIRVANEVHNSTHKIEQQDHNKTYWVVLYKIWSSIPSMDHFQQPAYWISCVCPWHDQDATWQEIAQVGRQVAYEWWVYTLACPCNIHLMCFMLSTWRWVMSPLTSMWFSFQVWSLANLLSPPSEWQMMCCFKKPHHLPGTPASNNEFNFKSCKCMCPQWTLIWSLGQQSTTCIWGIARSWTLSLTHEVFKA